MRRFQYKNIAHCEVVDVSYKDWNEGGKAWLMVRWFIIFHGKHGFEISSQNLWGRNNVQNVPIRQTKDCGDSPHIYIHVYIYIYIYIYI